MSRKWTDKRTVIHAIEKAIDYEYTYLDAVGPVGDEADHSRDMIEKFRRVLKRVTGRKATLKEIWDEEVYDNDCEPWV